MINTLRRNIILNNLSADASYRYRRAPHLELSLLESSRHTRLNSPDRLFSEVQSMYSSLKRCIRNVFSRKYSATISRISLIGSVNGTATVLSLLMPFANRADSVIAHEVQGGH